MSFIGIDLGTSFIKGAVLDLDARRLEHIHRIPFPDPLPGLPLLCREFAPQGVLAATRELLDDLAPYAEKPALSHRDASRSGAEGCEGVVMCSQMHGLVFTTDRGEPASNLTTWQDQRVLEPHPSGQGTYFDVMAGRISPDQLRQLGNELRPGQPVGVLFWLAEQRSPAPAGRSPAPAGGRLPGPDVFLASLPDFVLANLCGTEPTTETTNAMAHGALNLETLDWHREVLANLGLGRLRWPRIRRHGEVVGYLKVGRKSVPCYTPVGDYQCALTGALLQAGELSLNISTGSQVSLLHPVTLGLPPRLEFGDFQTRPFFDGRFLKGVTHIPAGRALNALVKLLSELAETQGIALADPWGTIARAAAEAGPTALRVNLAFFTSSCGDRGEIANVREEELTVGHLFRAAFQNMADNYYACALRLSPERSWRNLVFSGGLAQKIEVLRALICEKFSVPHRLCPTSEDTMLGLLALALAFTGRAGSVEQAMASLFAAYREESLT